MSQAGTLNISSIIAIPITVPNGGTGRSSLTAHSVLIGEGVSPVGFSGPGSVNTFLQGQGASSDPIFSTIPNAALDNSSVTLNSGNNITVTGSPLSLGGVASFNLTGTTNHTVQLGNSSGSLTSLANGSTGQVLTAVSGNDPTWSAVSLSPTYTSVNFAASPYTVLTTDQYISVDSSGGAVTLRFPNAPTTSKTYTIKDRTGNAATNNITYTTVGGAVTIDGATSNVININYGSINLLFNATSYEAY